MNHFSKFYLSTTLCALLSLGAFCGCMDSRESERQSDHTSVTQEEVTLPEQSDGKPPRHERGTNIFLVFPEWRPHPKPPKENAQPEPDQQEQRTPQQ